MTNKALIAMSGGVDSSVAAFLTKDMGYDATGITLKLFDNEDIGEKREKTCCSLDDIDDARRVCLKLGIPYYVYNFKDSFKENVIDRFIRAYENGTTPNPCIDCNRFIKFEKLIRRAEELDFDCVVTGHYSTIEYDKGADRYLLKKSVDRHKRPKLCAVLSYTKTACKKHFFRLAHIQRKRCVKLQMSLV